MKVRLMRTLDVWFGVPLCFLLSGLHAVGRSVAFKKQKIEKDTNIVFIKLSEMGAIIMAYPLLQQIQKRYPHAELFFVTFKRNKDIFLLLGNIIPEKNILAISEDSLYKFFRDTVQAMVTLWQKKIDVVFDLEFFSRYSAIISYLIKAHKRVGFYRFSFEGLYRGNLCTHKVLYNPLSHISKTYLSLGHLITKPKKDMPELEQAIDPHELIFPRYVTRFDVRRNMEERLAERGITDAHRLFLLNPGEGVLSVREWPLEYFIALSRSILEDSDNYIIIIGTKLASSKAQALQQALNHHRCIDFTGSTSLVELMELFTLAHALITSDCGLAHLAMLSPIRVFVIFGPESPQVFAPLGRQISILYADWPCSPCFSVLNHRNSFCKDSKCLKSIRPEMVYERMRAALKINDQAAV